MLLEALRSAGRCGCPNTPPRHLCEPHRNAGHPRRRPRTHRRADQSVPRCCCPSTPRHRRCEPHRNAQARPTPHRSPLRERQPGPRRWLPSTPQRHLNADHRNGCHPQRPPPRRHPFPRRRPRSSRRRSRRWHRSQAVTLDRGRRYWRFPRVAGQRSLRLECTHSPAQPHQPGRIWQSSHQ